MTEDRVSSSSSGASGAPPQVIWITAGNTSTARMREILSVAFPTGLDLIRKAEPLVEISESSSSSRG